MKKNNMVGTSDYLLQQNKSFCCKELFLGDFVQKIIKNKFWIKSDNPLGLILFSYSNKDSWHGSLVAPSVLLKGGLKNE